MFVLLRLMLSFEDLKDVDEELLTNMVYRKMELFICMITSYIYCDVNDKLRWSHSMAYY